MVEPNLGSGIQYHTVDIVDILLLSLWLYRTQDSLARMLPRPHFDTCRSSKMTGGLVCNDQERERAAGWFRAIWKG